VRLGEKKNVPTMHQQTDVGGEGTTCTTMCFTKKMNTALLLVLQMEAELMKISGTSKT
jgi:hypothetical protein